MILNRKNILYAPLNERCCGESGTFGVALPQVATQVRFCKEEMRTTADYIVVEMAKQLLGENWLAEYVAKANHGGIERVLL